MKKIGLILIIFLLFSFNLLLIAKIVRERAFINEVEENISSGYVSLNLDNFTFVVVDIVGINFDTDNLPFYILRYNWTLNGKWIYITAIGEFFNITILEGYISNGSIEFNKTALGNFPLISNLKVNSSYFYGKNLIFLDFGRFHNTIFSKNGKPFWFNHYEGVMIY